MKYNYLKGTDIKVSQICFGSLTMIPSQGNLSVREGAELISYAYERGINFIDTAELYDNYTYIKAAMDIIGRENYVIATKSYAYDRKTAEDSLNNALKGLNTDYIDLFLLHEQESIHTIRGHMEALDYFRERKEAGVIRALGISTHKIAGVSGFNQYDFLDVIHPMINYKGIGILDGTRDQMLAEINKARLREKGVYAMKVLAGGHLIPDIEEAFQFIRQIDVDSVAVGMQSKEEVDCNIALIETGKYPEAMLGKLRDKKRKLLVADYCIGCGKCVDVCKHSGIILIDGKAVPTDKCILCGYCARYCPDFCIKVV